MTQTTQTYQSGPNQHAPSNESQRISREQELNAFPMDHLKQPTAVTEAEAIVREAYRRTPHPQEQQQMPEFDIQAEQASIESIRHASAELIAARMSAIESFMFNGGDR